MSDYLTAMTPYANKASSALGIPTPVILAQWALETGHGTSVLAKQHNNHAGIKATSGGKDYTARIGSLNYAGYNDMNKFVLDYIRVMNLSYYKEVRAVGKTGDIAGTVRALDKSPWAEDEGYYGKIMGIITGGGSKADYQVPSGSTDLLGDIKKHLGNLNESQIKQFAMIGLGVVMLRGLIK